VMGIFKMGSRGLFVCASFKPQSSWVARIISVSHWRPATVNRLFKSFNLHFLLYSLQFFLLKNPVCLIEFSTV
jgi:hypothetical protein